jgi:hypothetical protein
MHTYQREDGYWAVGFELATVHGFRHWRAIRNFPTETLAAAYTSFLNGGEAMWPEWRQPE